MLTKETRTKPQRDRLQRIAMRTAKLLDLFRSSRRLAVEMRYVTKGHYQIKPELVIRWLSAVDEAAEVIEEAKGVEE
jgi:hypothetical protein